MTGDELLGFINNTLFPKLKELDSSRDRRLTGSGSSVPSSRTRTTT